jgi:hypothetical protein
MEGRQSPTKENNMSSLSPGFDKDSVRELADAVRSLRPAGESQTKMAGTFSAPQALNHDQQFA